MDLADAVARAHELWVREHGGRRSEFQELAAHLGRDLAKASDDFALATFEAFLNASTSFRAAVVRSGGAVTETCHGSETEQERVVMNAFDGEQTRGRFTGQLPAGPMPPFRLEPDEFRVRTIHGWAPVKIIDVPAPGVLKVTRTDVDVGGIHAFRVEQVHPDDRAKVDSLVASFGPKEPRPENERGDRTPEPCEP